MRILFLTRSRDETCTLEQIRLWVLGSGFWVLGSGNQMKITRDREEA